MTIGKMLYYNQIPHFVRNDDSSFRNIEEAAAASPPLLPLPPILKLPSFRRSEATEKSNVTHSGVSYKLKTLLLSLGFLFASTQIFAGVNDSLYNHLINSLKNKSIFEQQKEREIDYLKQMTLPNNKLTQHQTYDINTKLYEEYKKYQLDSALNYILKNQAIAKKLGLQELVWDNQIKLANLDCARGMFIESKDLLTNINVSQLPVSLRSDYYETYLTFCSNYAQSNDNSSYYARSELYRDSLLNTLDPASMAYKTVHAAKLLYSGQAVDSLLIALLNETKNKDIDIGTIAYYLGYYYQTKQEKDLAEKYYMISAISDVENSVKENASLHALALIYFTEGNIGKAQLMMQAAIDDAVFCNARYRITEISSIYPIINNSYLKNEKRQNRILSGSIVIISLFLLFSAIGLSYIYKQNKRLTVIKNKLYDNNFDLNKLNTELAQTTERLSASNVIKEEYIAHFFDMSSAYIEKLDAFRKQLNNQLRNNQKDELKKTLNSTDLIELEREELYNKFDLIFLNLYPTFVKDFNALQNDDGQVNVKRGVLNTELRIFALIRLGITDSVKIAGFLKYSISTVYNYRVRARNNAIIPRELFEETVMKIGNNLPV